MQEVGVSSFQSMVNLVKNVASGVDARASRVCYICYKEWSGLHPLVKRVFQRCEFELPDLVVLHRLWPRAAGECIEEVVCAQYRLSVDDIDSRTHMLLLRNKEHVAGHNRLVLQLCFASDWNDDRQVEACIALARRPQTMTCSQLRCDRNICQRTLTVADGLELLVAPGRGAVTNLEVCSLSL